MKYRAIFRRDLYLTLQQGWAAPLGFFLIIMLSFPLGMVMPQNLLPFAPAFIWTGLLLATLLALPRLFEADLADGMMDFLLIETKLPSVIILAKSSALWVGASLPLVGLVPLAGLMFGMSAPQLGSLMASAFIGSMALVLLGSFAAALTAGLRAASWLAPLIALPLELPVLIFGTQAAHASLSAFFLAPASLILMGLVLMALALVPASAAAALQFSCYGRTG